MDELRQQAHSESDVENYSPQVEKLLWEWEQERDDRYVLAPVLEDAAAA